MPEAIQLVNAQLTAGPPTAGDGSVFPSGQALIAMDLLPPQKPYGVTTGRQLFNVSSSNAFTTLPGVGSAGPVAQGHTLYLRSNAPFLVELTMTGVDGGAPQQLSVNGTLVLELNPNNPLTLLQVQGAGQLEVLIVGNQ